jgi:hypothetical protein
MKPEELLAHATTFSFLPPGLERTDPNAKYFEVTVERRSEGRWAVINLGQAWDGEDWVYESLPSSREDEFLKKARFSLEEAVEIAQASTLTVKGLGFPYEEFVVRNAERLARIKKEQEN